MEKKKMLIVEDDELILDTLAHRFRDENFYATAVNNGEWALKNITEDCPDVLLLDLLIPGIDGMELIRRVRKIEGEKVVRIILLTNLSDSAKVAEAISYGVNDYLIKSDWKLESLVKKVKEYFM